MLKSVVVASCLCAAMGQALSAELSGQQINELVAGATVEIDTPVGTKLPIRYGRDGKLVGKAGDLAWYLGAAVDDGRWWVASDQLCHKWRHWFSSAPQCLRLSRHGRIIRWRNRDGYSGTARISAPPPIRTAAVVPPARPARAEDAAASEAPPAPAGAAHSPDKPKEPPSAEAPADAGQPPRPIVKEAAKPPPVETHPATGMSPPPPQPPRPAVKEAAGPPLPAEARTAPTESAPPPKQVEAKGEARLMFRVANVRSDDVLNVRSGPSADFDIVGRLPPGSRGIAITSACRSSWCPVQHHATSGWVNSAYLAAEEPVSQLSALRDAPRASRTCLTAAARALLDRIEQKFGRVQVISTCRPGATVPGTWRASRHASGNAVDFKAGNRKAAIVEWLIANHRSGGTMTYSGMDHIHVDIGPHFVSIAGGPHWRSWRESRSDGSGLR